ncbi:cytochrome b [Aeromonas schubertii]|uniref:Cytochrome b n=1 Tax=Aeromonas schubertii TaxID=652 RepID=A0A0S2SKW3_9GAMM|nr:cytochrome b [Aeromonas schubertii]ALP42346.1 cytochrome b561 [Aeromonas schubertii]KUE80975.1 cytochrome B [Aeromonas schubertii]MBZ6064786.1 cytochrome b [Aeromonas schubertii]MBZ6073321.1 cytochrome b [Aeromonas schubertii]QCG46718.1 cytochrome b [Aeromonas schubertii]
MIRNSEQGYGLASATLHWLTLILIIAVYSTMEFRGVFPKGSVERDLMKQWHFMLGLGIFFIALGRVLLRLLWPTPRIVPTPPAWMEKLAHLAHLALYALIILLPLLGWLTLSAAGKPIPFFGGELPPLIAPNPGLRGPIKETHELIANLGYALIALHGAAALYHHHILKDTTLTNMLPHKR